MMGNLFQTLLTSHGVFGNLIMVLQTHHVGLDSTGGGDVDVHTSPADEAGLAHSMDKKRGNHVVSYGRCVYDKKQGNL